MEGHAGMTEIGSLDIDGCRARILAAAQALDAVALREALLEALLVGGVDATVADVMVPVLHDVGERWEQGEFGVLHEHFVSAAFGAALAEIRLPVARTAPVALMACTQHELHDLPLDLFGAMLSTRGWRTVALGANTPMGSLAEGAHRIRPTAIVLAAVRPRAFASRVSGLRRLARRTPVFIAGAAADALADDIPGVTVLPPDWRAAAALVHRTVGGEAAADAG